MDANIAVIEPLRRQLGIYDQQHQALQAATDANNGDDRLRHLAVEQEIANGIFLFERISYIDEQFHLAIFQGNRPFDPALDGAIGELYQLWAESYPSRLQEMEQLERRGLSVQGAEQFRNYCKEADGILTPDHEYFADDRLVQLRDDAVDADRQGQTVAMEEMSD